MKANLGDNGTILAWNQSFEIGVIKELIGNRSIPSGVYNISDDKPLSTIKLIELIGSSINKVPSIVNVNRKVILLLAKIGDLLHLPLNSERLNKLTEN